MGFSYSCRSLVLAFDRGHARHSTTGLEVLVRPDISLTTFRLVNKTSFHASRLCKRFGRRALIRSTWAVFHQRDDEALELVDPSVCAVGGRV